MQQAAISIEQHHVQNFWQGRGSAKPLAIVEQMLPASLEEIAAIFDGKPTNDGYGYKVSAHYGIGRDGRVWQFVRDEDTAWSNGILNQPDPALDWLNTAQNPNLVTLSIGYENPHQQDLSEEQYAAAVALHRQLTTRWQIPVDAKYIVGQDKLDSVTRAVSPGSSFPWSRLLQDLQETTTPEQPVEDELEAFDQAMAVTIEQPQSQPEDELDELEAFMLEPEQGIVQQEAALYEIDATEKEAVPTKSQTSHESNTFDYDMELDKILARQHEPQPVEEVESFELELDKILAQAAATEAEQTRPGQQPTVDDDFGLPAWLNQDEDNTLQTVEPPTFVPEATASTPAEDDSTQQFKLPDAARYALPATQPFAVQPPNLATPDVTPPTNIPPSQPQPESKTESVPIATEPAEAITDPPSKEQAGVVKVELANVRHRPSFGQDSIMRTVEEGERLHFDREIQGPELYGGTLWLHITSRDGDGWIHATLVELDKPLNTH